MNGQWQFRLDPKSEGEANQWYSRDVSFSDSIQVPGCWQAQGFGERSGILRHQYVGDAWYRRSVPVPADWRDKRVALKLGGAIRRGTLFVNGRKVGEHDGFSAPFQFDITEDVRVGAENVIALRVTNPGPVISESPDKQTPKEPAGMLIYAGNWGGIYGGVDLEATEGTWIEQMYVTSNLERKLVKFQIEVSSREPGNSFPAQLSVTVSTGQQSQTHQATADLRIQPGQTSAVDLEVGLPEALPWSPEAPTLYTALITLKCGTRECDRVEQRFGMREVTTRGNVLLLNGKPLYLRGYGDDNVEVLTGVPPASTEVYRKRLQLAKSFGFNAVRFHSMTPVREFFEAADEVGLLVMAELPVAYTQYFLPHKEFLRNELKEILLSHRNHPSFLSLALGNEFNLSWLKSDRERKDFIDTVAEFYSLAKKLDPAQLILSNDGYLMRPTDMASLYRDFPEDVPTVRHEFGSYYCSLPDISLVGKFTGVVTPTWLEAKKQWVETRRLVDQYPIYLRNSQRLQQLGRKYQIERARLNPDVTGYHYWLIADFPGGTGEGDSWEEGWFDYFWQTKGITPEEGQEINSPVLLMINAGINDRTLWSDATKDIDVLISNYGPSEIQKGDLRWKFVSEGKVLSESTVTGISAPLGKVTRVATIEFEEPRDDEAHKVELVLELNYEGASYSNRWNFWTFTRRALLQSAEMDVVSTIKWAGLARLYQFIQVDREPSPTGLLLTSSLNTRALQSLQAGGRVFLMADRDQFEGLGDATFFPSSGGAVGTLIQNTSALSGFPHEGFCDLQFYNLLEGAYSYSLDDYPREMVPLIGGIRTTTGFLSKIKNLS
ncbi:MAG TPA: glycoside hydrolase family 2 TIM barrel-domain containing protein, partial [Terriglobia bacterium]|nr:glycoside hydrolase family 2 TIM barrel-domain containing protein [Terriglobia bacterium]